MLRLLSLCVAGAALLANVADAVDRSKFRTCDQAAFCRRHRSTTAEPEFRLLPDSVKASDGVLAAALHSAATGAPHFDLKVFTFDNGAARVKVLEKTDMSPRWESPDIIQDHQLTKTEVTVVSNTDAVVTRLTGGKAVASGVTYATYNSRDGLTHLLSVKHDPLKVDLYVDGYGSVEPAISVNERGLMYFEHRRSKEQNAAAIAAAAGGNSKPERKIVDWDEAGKAIYEDGTHGDDGEHKPHEDAAAPAVVASSGDEAGLWEESFGSHSDSKPFGPTSVGIDISFPSAAAVYGIPEHASSHALKSTDGSEGAEYKQPYRLYNLDVFEYELDNPMSLYGSIPFMLAHSGTTGSTVGVFWNNPTETYIDISKHTKAQNLGISTRWISESGVFDLTLVPGPSPKGAVQQFTALVGTQGLPPMFALGYHQCRWNYKDEADVYGVDSKFDEYAFPYDVLWLDIEHTDGKRYFTWDKSLFPNPTAMQEKLGARGHKMVTIIDPHIKRDGNYKIHSEASSKGLYTRNKDGNEYDGWCWPGSSSYLDFTDSKTRDWWADQFSYDRYAGSTQHLYTWNDMNEPSVFNGPEVSMNKDAKSIAGVEHREWHNLYGFYQIMATHEGQLRRNPERNTRSFVLSRAFYAGTQRYGAIWTGDNAARWDHLVQAAPMLLTIGVSGLTFSGADVGGFFQNPTTELMVRWYQAGSWQPFFRAHAHIDTARREPWLFGDETLAQLRDIVRTRYTYLPLWYTLFYMANQTGVPTMRPMWMEYPTDVSVFNMDNQWMVGSDILVCPVTSQGSNSVNVYFPGQQPWYDVQTYAKVAGGSGSKSIDAVLTKIPAYQRGGAIVPRQMRARRSSQLMRDDPYTLVVTLDSASKASGQLYLDDGITFDFQRKGAFRLRQFDYAPASAQQHVLKSIQVSGGKVYAPSNTVERIVVAGLNGKAPASITAQDGDGGSRSLTFTYDAAADVLTIRKPDVKVAYDWSIQLNF